MTTTDWKYVVIGNTIEKGLKYKSVKLMLSRQHNLGYALEFGDELLFKQSLIKRLPALGPIGGPFDYVCTLASSLHFGWDNGSVKPYPSIGQHRNTSSIT